MCPVKFNFKSTDDDLKNPSNKGQFLEVDIKDLDNIIAKGNNYYITLPFIDKITLFADLDLNAKEKKQLNGILYNQAKNKEEGNAPDSPVELMKLTKKQARDTRYKNHFRITPPNSNGSVAFFLNPVLRSQRFIKMEFSPWKLGPEAMSYFIMWYNDHIVHSTYEDAIKLEGCIGKLHIAFDIVGVHIADLILNYDNGSKSNEWHGATGRIETQYPNAKAGKPSTTRIYNKAKQAKETGEHTPYPKDMPIVRVEKEIETQHSLKNIHKLKQTHFKDVRLPLPLDLTADKPEQEHHWKLFLDSVRYRGVESALKILPQELRAPYNEHLEKCIVEVFPHDKLQQGLWKQYWPKSLERSKIIGA